MRKSNVRILMVMMVFGIITMCWAALKNDSVKRTTVQVLDEPEPVIESTTPALTLTEVHPDRLVHVNIDGKLVTMNLEDYILDVVAAEMPATFELEALKAQAVAARTFTIRKIMYGGCNSLKGADICSKSNHCQAFSTQEQMQSKWQNNYDANTTKLLSAVEQTRGEILTYDNQPILMLYHASSYGFTENVENVYSKALPYLRSVSSPEVSNDTVTTREEFERIQFVKDINAAYPKAGLSASQLEKQISILSRFPSGRVNMIKLGGAAISAIDLRHIIEMRSTNFTIGFDRYSVILTTRGYGHGVGMSQTGANVMAQEGSGYMDILSHYYTGTKLTKLN